MGVGVDEAGQDCAAISGNRLDSTGSRVPDADDLSVSDVNARLRDHTLAVEHPDVADDELG
jgi:hypothetical protein